MIQIDTGMVDPLAKSEREIKEMAERIKHLEKENRDLSATINRLENLISTAYNNIFGELKPDWQEEMKNERHTL